MAEYLPIHTPGQSMTSTASATITGGQVLVVSGNGTVAAHTNGTNDFNIVGVALTTAAGGAKVRYQKR